MKFFLFNFFILFFISFCMFRNFFNVFFSPLDQFELNVGYYAIDTYFIIFSINNFVVFSVFIFFMVLMVFFVSFFEFKIFPSNFQLFIELFYKFVLRITLDQIGLKGVIYFPFFLLLFLYIIILNIFCLLPYSLSITAQFFITFTLAFVFNFSFFLLGLFLYGIEFFNIFLPKHTPKIIQPLIVFIEILSYTIRTFSLSLRLFANLSSGHTLLHILCCVLYKNYKISWFLCIVPFVILIFVLLLECAIAFLQAYVFLTLACIYLNDILYFSH